jgi:hypothetical protein
MDISTDRSPRANPPSLPAVVWNAVRRMVERLIDCMTLTEADRVKAGIYIRRWRA